MRKNIIIYIVGSLAILAFVTMNFNYAYHNYGIPKKEKSVTIQATTAPTLYQEEKQASFKNCPRYAYDVIVYDRLRHPHLEEDMNQGWLGSKPILFRKTFISLSLSDALTQATSYANQYNAEQTDETWAVVDHHRRIIEVFTDAYFIQCKKGGKLKDCKTSDIECEPLDIES